MQDRYAGDIGDYVKLAILRALSPGHRLGVAWWLFPDEAHNADGRHVGYLDQPQVWRSFDPALFDHLRGLIASGERRVAGLQSEALLPGAVYFDEPIPTLGRTAERRLARAAWGRRLERAVHDCDLIFLDPDNGLETKGFDAGAAKAGKSVSLAELQALRAPGRTLVVYHHQTRMAGGHLFELDHWGERLLEAGFGRVDVLRATPFSPRAFFILDAPLEMRVRAARLAQAWGERLTWRPDVGWKEAADAAEPDIERIERVLGLPIDREMYRASQAVVQALDDFKRAVAAAEKAGLKVTVFLDPDLGLLRVKTHNPKA